MQRAYGIVYGSETEQYKRGIQRNILGNLVLVTGSGIRQSKLLSFNSLELWGSTFSSVKWG